MNGVDMRKVFEIILLVLFTTFITNGGQNQRARVFIDFNTKAGNQNLVQFYYPFRAGDTLYFEIRGDSLAGLIAYDFRIGYDTSYFQFLTATANSNISGEVNVLRLNGGSLFTEISNEVTPGEVVFATLLRSQDSSKYVSGSGLLGVLSFRVKSSNFTSKIRVIKANFLDYQNGKDTITYNVDYTVGSVQLVNISEARVDADSNYVPDKLDQILAVEGIVTSINYTASAGSSSYYIQDGTGGINVFLSGQVVNLDPGDRIRVVGKIIQFRGLTEISPFDSSGIILISKGNQIPSPVRISVRNYLANAEAYEGRLIRIDSLWKASGTWPRENLDANLLFVSFDKQDTILIRIDRDTDIDGQREVQYPVSVVGIASQFTNKIPPNDGYQILPRFYTDFIPINLPPSAFSLTSPGDNYSFQFLFGDTLLTFTWDKSMDLNVPPDSVMYKFQIYFPSTGRLFKRDSLTTNSYNLTYSEILPYFLGTDTVITGQWRVIAFDSKGAETSSNQIFNIILRKKPVLVSEYSEIPKEFALYQNYPNPFNPTTLIKFDVPKETNVKIVIYDILGRVVKNLVDENLKPGAYKVIWDGTDASGAKLPSGIYFYSMITENYINVKKMVLLK